MLSLESDEMTALRLNNGLTFFSYIEENISPCLTSLGNVWRYLSVIVPYGHNLMIFNKGWK